MSLPRSACRYSAVWLETKSLAMNAMVMCPNPVHKSALESNTTPRYGAITRWHRTWGRDWIRIVIPPHAKAPWRAAKPIAKEENFIVL